MIHPSELLRANSVEGRQFAAPANIIDENTIDCGIANLPCLNKLLKLERFAKLKLFVFCLSLVGFLHGLTLAYFRSTAQIWGKHYNLNDDSVDWIIYTNEFFVGLFALVVSYWGNRIHRMSWIGGLAIFLSFSCLFLIIPETHRHNYHNETISPDNLCQMKSGQMLKSQAGEVNVIAFVILGLFQVMYAMASVSFITHGVSYIDDNSTEKQSPAAIGVVLAARELGTQAGLYLAGFPIYLNNTVVFTSPVWICASVATFLAGSLVAMFPRYLPSIMVERVSASILDIASGVIQPIMKETVDGYFRSLYRLLKNGTLMINILSFVFIQSAIINFMIFEKPFNQTQFFIAHKNDSSLIRFTTNLLKQPLVAISVVATGMIIAKTKPQIRTLVKYNIIIFFVALLTFVSGAFLHCDDKLETEYVEKKSHPYCNSHCSCSYAEFQPVCIQSKTFYSPCLAGCSSIKEINSNNIYQNCTCGAGWFKKSNLEGTEGACNSTKCDLFWALSQANGIFLAALLSSTLVTNLMIIMRCVRGNDKALALGLQYTFLGLVPYLPVKIIYDALSDAFCQYRSDGICRIYSKSFGLFLASSTVILMIISILLAIGLLIFMKVKCDKDEIDGDPPQELEPMVVQPPNRIVTSHSDEDLDLRLAHDGRTNSANSGLSRDSLLELENVGDDHDSIGALDLHHVESHQHSR